MDTLVQTLFDEIRKIPILDPHSHVDPRSPAAEGLLDLLGYHYYTELAHSAGLAKEKIEKSTGLEKAKAIVGHLHHCSNTVQMSWLVEIAQNLFDFPHAQLTLDNVQQLFESAERKTATGDWPQQVIRATNLEGIFLTNDFDDPLEGFDTRFYVPCLRTDDLVFKLHDSSVRARLEKGTGENPNLWQAVLRGIDRLFDHFTKKGARACAISLPPDFEPQRPGEQETIAAYDRLIKGSASSADRRTVAYAVFYALADRCEDFQLPFDLMIGVYRDVFPAGVHQGRDLFDNRTSLYQFRHLFNDKCRVTFPISVLTHQQNQELVSYAWIFPNVVTNGHWWYSNIPTYIESDTRSRLEAVPQNKQIGYYSDAYKLEFVLPKFNMYRRNLATVLARDFVVGRGWSEGQALALARTVLRENVDRIFPARR
ncbi:MAG: glucuronate isomerase [Planctomycetota bacterium]